jgi:hypothetical protein
VSKFIELLQILVPTLLALFGVKFFFEQRKNKILGGIIKSKELDDEIKRTEKKVEESSLDKLIADSNERHRPT